jgi:hypothetical protein
MSKLKNNSAAVPFVTNLNAVNSSVGGAAAATSNFSKQINTKQPQQLQSSTTDVLQLKASAYSNANTALTTRNQAKQLEIQQQQQQQQQQQKKKRTALENISNVSNVIKLNFYI